MPALMFEFLVWPIDHFGGFSACKEWMTIATACSLDYLGPDRNLPGIEWAEQFSSQFHEEIHSGLLPCHFKLLIEQTMYPAIKYTTAHVRLMKFAAGREGDVQV